MSTYRDITKRINPSPLLITLLNQSLPRLHEITRSTSPRALIRRAAFTIRNDVAAMVLRPDGCVV
jgi:hypothetical protein